MLPLPDALIWAASCLAVLLCLARPALHRPYPAGHRPARCLPLAASRLGPANRPRRTAAGLTDPGHAWRPMACGAARGASPDPASRPGFQQSEGAGPGAEPPQRAVPHVPQYRQAAPIFFGLLAGLARAARVRVAPALAPNWLLLLPLSACHHRLATGA